MVSQWILPVVVTLMSVTPAAAQPAAHVSGLVVDATGTPVPGVMVTIRGPVVRFALTDSGGGYKLANLPEGTYELVATHDGFAPVRRELRLASGDSVTLSLTLSVLFEAETVVTAARAGEMDIQSTPMAVSVLSGARLEREAAHTIAQIAGLAPSVTFSQNTGFAQLTIRGIGTNAVFAGSDPSSAVYLDGVYLARPAMVLADFLDVERVEVLRGPQGTLYGRNTVGGAINLVTRMPTDEVEASARVMGGNEHMLRTEARVQGPLVHGRIMAGAAFLRGVRRGPVLDLNHQEHRLGGDDVTAARGQVRIVFDPRAELSLSSDFTHQDPNPLTWAKVLVVKPAFEGQVDNPADLHEVRTSTLAVGRNLQYGVSARFSLDLRPSLRLTNVSAFRKLDYDRVVDTDITELELNATDIHEMQHQWSHELTISQQRRAVTWLAGFFLFDELDRQPTSIRMGGTGLETLLNPRVSASSSALFGHATLRLTRLLSASAGLRYTRERKAIDNAGEIQTIDVAPAQLVGSAYAYTDVVSHHPVTPKFGLEIQALTNTLVYASATKGFKSGGFNLTSRERGLGYGPETAWSYEAGAKTLFARRRATANLAIFRTSYTDLQVSSGIRPGVISIANAAAATIRGVELETIARVGGAVSVGGHVSWLDARYDRYIATGVGGATADVAGHRLDNAPLWSGRIWAEWTAELSRAHTVSLRADWTGQTTVYYTAFNTSVERQTPYALLGLTSEFGPSHRRWSVSAFARNVANRDYITGTFGTPVTAIGARPGEPRQLGAQFTMRR